MNKTNLLTEDLNDSTDNTAPADSGADSGAGPNKPRDLPDKFWDADKGEIRIQALIDSYKALERRLSQSFDGPESEEGRFKFLRAMGLPDTPESYTIDTSHKLFEPDLEINRKMHEKGFTKDQAQLVYDLAAERMVPMVMDVAAEFQAERELERLFEHFGGEEQWREVSRQLLAYGRKNLPAEVLKGLSSSFEGVLALYRMMQEDSGGEGRNMARIPDDAGNIGGLGSRLTA